MEKNRNRKKQNNYLIKKSVTPRNKSWLSLDWAGERAPAAREIRARDDLMPIFCFISESVSDDIPGAVSRMFPAVTRNQISVRPFEILVSRLEIDSSQSHDVIHVS
jgi:hypothetical protein